LKTGLLTSVKVELSLPDNPLLRKLMFKPDHKIAILNSPLGYIKSLGELPVGVEIDPDLVGMYDIIHAFYTHFQALESQVENLKSSLVDGGILWLSYPKQTAKQESDLNRDILREKLAGKGLNAVAQVSIDEIWSALHFKRL
jgi:hypothetical protein